MYLYKVYAPAVSGGAALLEKRDVHGNCGIKNGAGEFIVISGKIAKIKWISVA